MSNTIATQPNKHKGPNANSTGTKSAANKSSPINPAIASTIPKNP